jgi:hypothetical protein
VQAGKNEIYNVLTEALEARSRAHGHARSGLSSVNEDEKEEARKMQEEGKAVKTVTTGGGGLKGE